MSARRTWFCCFGKTRRRPNGGLPCGKRRPDGSCPAPEHEPPGPRCRPCPPIDAVTDSPGVRLAYRLPIDAASGWVSFTMAAVCLVWNTLVAIFVVQMIQQHVAGKPNWLLTWLMVPFVLAGLWTLFALGSADSAEHRHRHHAVSKFRTPVVPGRHVSRLRLANGRLHVRWLQVQLVCEEQAVYQQGTDTRRGTTACIAPRCSASASSISRRSRCVRNRVRIQRPAVGDALVRVAAQRGHVDAGGARPDGSLGRFRTAFSGLCLSRHRDVATAVANPYATAARG